MKSMTLVSFLAVGAAAAQQPEAPAATEAVAWPKLDRIQQDRVDTLLANFRLDNPELHAASERELIELGAGAAPQLLGRISDSKTNSNDVVERVLDAVTAAEHAPLLAEHAAVRIVARRRYVVGRLAQLAPKDWRKVFGKAAKDKDSEVAFRAALGLLAGGDIDAMPMVFGRCRDDWREVGPRVEATLAGARGEAPSGWLCDRIDGGDHKDQVTGLILFRTLGVKEHARRIAKHLDSNQNQVKKEAINALRVVVDGEPALDNLSVFQAIEMARSMKGKL